MITFALIKTRYRQLTMTQPMKTIASCPMLRWFAPLCAVALVALQLLWEHFHGGVGSHNLLNRADLPAISNWWGLLTVPALASLTVQRAEKQQRSFSEVVHGFGIALVVGLIVATLFRANLHDIILYVLGAAMLLSLALPAYRIECVLGLVVGMMFVFGGVLPLIPAIPIVLVSLLFRAVIWRGISRRR